LVLNLILVISINMAAAAAPNIIIKPFGRPVTMPPYVDGEQIGTLRFRMSAVNPEFTNAEFYLVEPDEEEDVDANDSAVVAGVIARGCLHYKTFITPGMRLLAVPPAGVGKSASLHSRFRSFCSLLPRISHHVSCSPRCFCFLFRRWWWGWCGGAW
jgi:hypothetical protein